MSGDEDEVTIGQTAYDIGYGKPPKDTRFRPGRSGNPTGKRNGNKSLKTIAREAFNEKISVRTPRGSRRMTKIQALLQTNLNAALKGDLRASDQIFKIAKELGLEDDIADALNVAQMQSLTEEDEDILARHLSPSPSGNLVEDAS